MHGVNCKRKDSGKALWKCLVAFAQTSGDGRPSPEADALLARKPSTTCGEAMEGGDDFLESLQMLRAIHECDRELQAA
jgi:hypothetical protein